MVRTLFVLVAALAPPALAAVTITQNTLLAPGDLSLEGQDFIVNNATLTVAGAHRFASLQLINGAVLTHEPATDGQAERAIRLTVSGDVTVDAASRIDVTGKGYAQADSPGAGQMGDYAGGGGGHGGRGHRSNGVAGAGGAAFGSPTAPDSWGGPGGNSDSSGGALVPGGGLVHLEVDGTLTIAGAVRADGASAPINNQSGGAGGTVYLKAGTLAGAGAISANGGAGEWVDGGGGSGGRIAIYYTSNDFSGAITAYGGGGHQRGGAGTIYTRRNGTAFGQLLVHNGGVWGNYTPLTSPEAFQLTLAEMAHVYPAEPLTVQDLIIGTNTVLTHLTGQARCEVTVLNNATIAAGGSINTDGRGYPIGDDPGPGAGVNGPVCGAGVAHGGNGGVGWPGDAAGGQAYGSILEPTDFGSSGGGSSRSPSRERSPGGGAAILTVGGTFTL